MANCHLQNGHPLRIGGSMFLTTVKPVPSGKLTVCYGKSPFFIWVNPLWMAIFNSFLYVYQRVDVPLHQLIEYSQKKVLGQKKAASPTTKLGYKQPWFCCFNMFLSTCFNPRKKLSSHSPYDFPGRPLDHWNCWIVLPIAFLEPPWTVGVFNS